MSKHEYIKTNPKPSKLKLISMCILEKRQTWGIAGVGVHLVTAAPETKEYYTGPGADLHSRSEIMSIIEDCGKSIDNRG